MEHVGIRALMAEMGSLQHEAIEAQRAERMRMTAQIAVIHELSKQIASSIRAQATMHFVFGGIGLAANVVAGIGSQNKTFSDVFTAIGKITPEIGSGMATLKRADETKLGHEQQLQLQHFLAEVTKARQLWLDNLIKIQDEVRRRQELEAAGFRSSLGG